MANFGSDFGPFGINLGHQTIFLQLLFLLGVKESSKLSSYAIYRKTNEPYLRKRQKKFEPNFGLFGPNLGTQNFFLHVLVLLVVKCCSKLSSYAI